MNKEYSLKAPVKKLVLSVSVTAALAGCSSFGELASDLSSSNINNSGFQKGVYASAGIGASRLTPDVDNFPSLDVNDRVEPAGQVTLGVDVTPTFSLELHSADLGSAGFSPSGPADGSMSAGRLNYHMNGVSALAYIGENKNNANRKGIKAYGRFGFASISNSAVNDTLAYQREDQAPVLVGAGVEYGTANGLGLRAEAMTNGSDASYAQVGLLYRIGLGSKAKPQLAEAMPAQRVEVMPAVAADNIIVSTDQVGTQMIDMVLFDVDSDRLTQGAQGVLSSVASQLSANPNAVLNLDGHADATGDSGYNLSLSDRRARNVARYLLSNGVRQSQLRDINGYGETSPAQDNSSASGRAANRRVELHAIGLAR